MIIIYLILLTILSAPAIFAEEQNNTPETRIPAFLINVNAEETDYYSYLEGENDSDWQTYSIKPLAHIAALPYVAFDSRLDPFLRTRGKDSYFSLTGSVKSKMYVTNEENGFIPGQSGLTLKKGANFFLFEDAALNYRDIAGMYYQFKQSWDSGGTHNDLLRAYIKMKFSKFSVEAGKDSVDLGPGEYGMLLSSNAEPFLMLKFQNEEPLKFFGYWNFIFLNGWLFETREKKNDASDPKILAMRLTYSPKLFHNYIELGATRTTFYGGKGRPTYELYEYPTLIAGKYENVPGSKWDNDGYGAYDISLYVPLRKLWPVIKTFKLYYQHAGTDILALWQMEEKEKHMYYPLVLFDFRQDAYQAGLFMAAENDFLRIEYAKTAYTFYINANYIWQGFSYKGLSLGYPYGRNAQSLLIKYRHRFEKIFSLESSFTVYQLPAFSANDVTPLLPLFSTNKDIMTRYTVSVEAQAVIKKLAFSLYTRIDAGSKTDIEPLPTQWDIKDKQSIYYTIGGSLTWNM